LPIKTETSKIEVIYSDIPTNLTIHPVKKDLTRLTNEDAVKRSVRNIILTNFYDRPYQLRIGSGLMGLLFEQFTPLTQQAIRSAILNAIANDEPRAQTLDCTVSADLDTGDVTVAVVFSVLNNSQPIVLTVTLDRVR